MKNQIKSILLMALGASILTMTSCVTALVPSNGEFDAPSKLESGEFEAAAAFTHQSLQGAELDYPLNTRYKKQNSNRMGVAGKFGAGEKLELGFNYNYLASNMHGSENTMNPTNYTDRQLKGSLIGISPKLVVKEDVLAFSAPITAYFSKLHSESFVADVSQGVEERKATNYTVRPTASFGIPVSERFKPYANISGNYGFGDDETALWNQESWSFGANIGATINATEQLSLQPAFGFQTYADDKLSNSPDPHSINFGMRVGYNVSK